MAVSVLAAAPACAQTLARQVFGSVASPTGGPAVPIGSYSRGCLAGGVSIPDAPGWQLMRPSRGRHWGHPEMVGFLDRLAAAARAAGWPGLYVGDISQPRGGPMATGHKSHQTGLDVDVWLRRPDRLDLSWDERETLSSTVVVAADGRSVNESWTPVHQAVIRAAASDPVVARVFVNPAIKRALCAGEQATDPAGRAWLGKVRPWTGHDAHFHVRLGCPPDDPACVEQAEVPTGDGCGGDLDRWFTDEGMLEIGAATRGIGAPELTLADLPAACESVATAEGGAAAPLPMTGALPPPAPVEQRIEALYGIVGSQYLWVLPFDTGNDGESGLALSVEGVLPPGIALGSGLNGRGLLRGQPTQAGDYAFRILGQGPGGVAARFDVTMTVEPGRTGSGAGATGAALPDFLRGYDGGGCFYVHAVRVLDSLSLVEAFAREPSALHRLDADIIAATGAEARIGGRMVAAGQCAALGFVRQVAGATAPAPTITLDDATVAAGDRVSGLVETPPGHGSLLMMIDPLGKAEILAAAPGGTSRFSYPVAGPGGPQLLIALALPEGDGALALRGAMTGSGLFDAFLKMASVAGGRAGASVRYFVIQ